MSEASTGEDVEVVNSTLTELVLLLAFLFMLISVVLAIKLNEHPQVACATPPCGTAQATQLSKPTCLWDLAKLQSTKDPAKSIDAILRITENSKNSDNLHVIYWATKNRTQENEKIFRTITGSTKDIKDPVNISLYNLIAGAKNIQSNAIGKDRAPCIYYARLSDEALELLTGPEQKSLSNALPNF